jgi:N-acetylmuramoyl-L-alanine amidase CwlA
MVTIRKIDCPKDKYSIKCPYAMKPEFVVIHNTANNASAVNEIAYMHRNNNTVSFHYAVDDKEIIQGLPLDRNSWNAGDGSNGKGNRKGISIEICYSKSGGARFETAQKNAAELTAKLLKDYGWGIDKVKKHQDFNGKHCPHRTLDDYGWDYFLNLVKGYMEPKVTKKSIDTIAKEVIAGKWGNGDARKKALAKAGYDYAKVQARVNELTALANKPKTYKKGDKVTLKSTPLYKDSATNKATKNISGTYYIYDGEKINGRYRITNKANRCGKKPLWLYVTGFVKI